MLNVVPSMFSAGVVTPKLARSVLACVQATGLSASSGLSALGRFAQALALALALAFRPAQDKRQTTNDKRQTTKTTS